MIKKLSLILLLAAFVAFVPACGGKKIKTEGVTCTVTLDGKPLANATVSFTPADGSGNDASGITDASGVCKMQTLLGAADAGTTPGKYLVTITCFEEIDTGKTYTNDAGNEVPVTEDKSVIPQKYASTKTSGLEAEVQKGANSFEFNLESK